ncbi:hypothetical protein COEREDRAFT_8754 [Coemansia reversa NRRL 1564]|uniref:Uncharacterized protein n=1 Tax=Coemansia reversa (strain ATCC 12441 / NRRL 1564) TaxID=763665 RepID=A0A2G5BAQ4_COERN|nr:hypothetical protein COEREDRAFT_8754 [Coemansia reversa NRRL 1564]|eukprot:PIA16096.1 hypothetical protein COEREDRAFT_8754 [Coemansia reversa NRRL 1564]
MSPTKKWPRVAILTTFVIFSVIPTSMYLFVPARAIEINSFCQIPTTPGTRFYIFTTCTVAVWQYMPGIIGIIGITEIGVYIIKTRRATRRVFQESVQNYGHLQPVQQQGNPELLHQTMIHIIWFPITPAVSLWLNMVLITVGHYKHRRYLWLEFVNIVLLGLQSFLLGIALIVNPTIRNAAAQWASRRRQEHYDKDLEQHYEVESLDESALPPIHPQGSVSQDQLAFESFTPL